MAFFFPQYFVTFVTEDLSLELSCKGKEHVYFVASNFVLFHAGDTWLLLSVHF